MGSKSKKKSYANQAEVAKLFSEWTGKTFKQVPRSGGLRWGGAFWTYGDIVPPRDLRLVIECKHYKEVRIEDLLGNHKVKNPVTSQIAEWWYAQTVPDAERCRRELELDRVEPMLCWKRDYGRIRLCINQGFLWEIDAHENVQSLPRLHVNLPGHDPFVILDLRDFFRVVPPTVCPRVE